MLYGEQLIAAVYDAVRNAPTWNRTLLIITYDEHGGCFDHVAPPPAIPPGGPYPDGFKFDRYGVRVPAVIISPYISPGSIIRPLESQNGKAAAPFEHASILATLHQLFDLGPPLTARAAAVPDLLRGLTLDEPDNDGPEDIEVDLREPSRGEAWQEIGRRTNHLQHGMRGPFTRAPATVARAVAHVRRIAARLLPADRHHRQSV